MLESKEKHTGKCLMDLILPGQYRTMVESIKGKRILKDSCYVKLECEMAREENPR